MWYAWYDPAVELDAVLARLRLVESDIDVALVAQAIDAAAAAITHDCDRHPDTPLPGPPPPPELSECLQTAAIAIYHRGGIVATVGAAVSPAAGAGQTAPFDPLVDVRAELTPFKQGWAFA